MREAFDQLQAEAERCELPHPAMVRARADRRAVAGRNTATALCMLFVVAGGLVASRPLLATPPEEDDSRTTVHRSGAPDQAHAVPSVVGLPEQSAAILLTQQGFQVKIQIGQPVKANDPAAGKVEQQDPVSQKRVPAQTIITIWIRRSMQGPFDCADGFPRQLPEKLFLPGGSELCFAPGQDVESLPNPCAPTAFETDSLIEDRRGFGNIIDEDAGETVAPTQVHQTITKYRDNGAIRFMGDLIKAVAQCGSVTLNGLRLIYSLVTNQTPVIGEQSLMLEAEYRLPTKPEKGPPAARFLVIVAQVGAHVLVCHDKGWEAAPSKRSTLVSACQQLANSIGEITSGQAPAR